jgi:TolB-like protein
MKALAALLLLGRVAWAASSPTVAVLPFTDLSGSKSSIGEAIRETVTTDLREVPGMRVIERANLERILAEQDLGAKKADLDPASTVKVGKLLGATLVVAGAYQRAAGTVRLTARFIKVETGEIVGTAKVDGPHSDFLALQDRITAELLKSAGVSQPVVKRARPKLKSLKIVELYGDAAVERDEDKKRELLQLALAEDASFSYAVRDLDALEKRMAAYDYAARRAANLKFKKLLEDVHAKLKGESDPVKLRELYKQLFTELEEGRRYHTLLVEARALRDHLPPPAPVPPGKVSFEEGAYYEVVWAEHALKQYDALLRDGESFLKKFPASKLFATVKAWMADAIERKRKVDTGKAAAAAELAKLDPAERNDPCATADVNREHAQYIEAQKLYRACLKAGKRQRHATLLWLIQVELELADWPSARAHLTELAAEKWDGYAGYRQGIEAMLPDDG